MLYRDKTFVKRISMTFDVLTNRTKEDNLKSSCEKRILVFSLYIKIRLFSINFFFKIEISLVTNASVSLSLSLSLSDEIYRKKRGSEKISRFVPAIMQVKKDRSKQAASRLASIF